MTEPLIRSGLYAGVNAAAITPYTADLAPDLPRMVKRCRHLLANGCDGLGVLGTTGEANSLGLHERKAVLEGLVAAGIPAARLMPGTGCPSLSDTVELTRHAREQGCPGVLMLPPFYYKGPSDDGLFAWFSEVISRVGGGVAIYLYHFPQQSAVPFSLALLARLIQAFPGTIRGVKDSSGSLENMLAMVREFASEGFEVYTGADDLLTIVTRAGGAGCITAAANVTSRVSGEVVAALRAGDDAAADAAQARLTPLRKAVQAEALIPGLRELTAREESDPAWRFVRPPFLPLSPEAAQRYLAGWDAAGGRMQRAA